MQLVGLLRLICLVEFARVYASMFDSSSIKFIVMYIFLANVVKIEIFRTPCILCQNYTAHNERSASIPSHVKLYKRRETAIGWKSEVPSIFSSSEDFSEGKVLPEPGPKTKPLLNFRGPEMGPVNLDFILRASLRAPPASGFGPKSGPFHATQGQDQA